MDKWNTTDYPQSPPLLIDFQGMILASLYIHTTVKCSSKLICLPSDLIYFIAKYLILTQIKGLTYFCDLIWLIQEIFNVSSNLILKEGRQFGSRVEQF